MINIANNRFTRLEYDSEGCGLCPGCGVRITRPMNSKYKIEDSHEGQKCQKCYDKEESI